MIRRTNTFRSMHTPVDGVAGEMDARTRWLWRGQRCADARLADWLASRLDGLDGTAVLTPPAIEACG